jgi:hypothetical protein
MHEMEPSRQSAIRVLAAALADERMSVEQFESRLALVRDAPNLATVDAIVADLLPSGGFGLPEGLPVVADRTAVVLPDDAFPVEPAEVLRISSVMGSTKRAGRWTVPLRLELKVVMGEMSIDLRDAVFCSDYLEIDLHVVLSSLTLIVPAGTQVENESEERFSSSTHSTRSTRGVERIGLLIRITGEVRLSSLDIKEKVRREDEPEKPAWRRLLGMGND